MSDFIKIFLVLCGIASAFVFGRSYGEKTILESKEYLKMQSESKSATDAEAQISNLKQKVQNLLDSSDLKKSEEILSQVMTLFLADLGLHLSDQQQKDFDLGKQLCVQSKQEPRSAQLPEKPILEKVEQPRPSTGSSNRQQGLNKYKAKEWFVTNAQNEHDVLQNLKKLEIKDLDVYLKNAPETSWAKSEKFFGSYRGRITDITNKDYGLLIVELKQIQNSKNEPRIKGKIEIYRGTKQESEGSFTTSNFGYGPPELLGTVVNVGQRYLQIYALESESKLAGLLYERLPNGTTKTTGTFILNRVDRF